MFTVPPLAKVGLTEADARSRELDIVVKAGDTHDWYSSRRVRAEVGAFKTIADAGSGLLLRAHLLGYHAEETINLFALAIRAGITAEQLQRTIFGYPTSASDVGFMI